MPRVKKYTDKERLEELQAFINICFCVLWDKYLDYKEVCNASGLSLSTIRRLHNGTYTTAIRFSTVQRLGAAAGLSLRLEENHISMAVRS